jgi:FkbM family methyltransferase
MLASPQRDLIFDLGMNHGEDTEFYLAKGFRVVAVEANPQLVQIAENKSFFREMIRENRLIILNTGIWDTANTLTFYVNTFNDHWSSFDPAKGKRKDQWSELKIPCVPIAFVLAKFGLPYYMKIDIEGGDEIVLRDLAALGIKPTFVSVEEFGPSAFDCLKRIGYTHTKLVPQKQKPNAVFPSQEGNHIARSFSGKDSGMFGLDLGDNWVPIDSAKGTFRETIRDEHNVFKAEVGEWFDIHAATLPLNTSADSLSMPPAPPATSTVS